MADIRTYPPGVPCWVDTSQPDQPAAAQFYGALFGWSFADAMAPDAPGSYLIATLDGADAAAIGAASGSDAVWNTYIAVDDADRIAQLVPGRGGSVISPPMDAGPGGRGATFEDPAGAQFSVWQPHRRLGAQVANVPGAWNFSDLHTSDAAGAHSFYDDLFGWRSDDVDFGDGRTVGMWMLPGYGHHLAATVDPDIHARQAAAGAPDGFADAVAWLQPLDPATDSAAHWHVTFAVADRDEIISTALGLGATDLSGPVDTAWTKGAVIRDPQGAVFSVSQFTPSNG